MNRRRSRPRKWPSSKHRGHRLRERDSWGNLQVVTFDSKTGAVSAASDPRGVGTAGLY